VADELQPDARVGRYVVVEKLGAGGMGEVYRARDETLEREVALKVLPAAKSDDGEARMRLLREARAAAKVRHPNLVAVHDAGTTETHEVYVVMELVEGMTLRAVLQEQPLGAADVQGVVTDLAAALQAIHDADLVHRDVKPENVMWRDDGSVALLDFGLAKPAPSEGLAAADAATAEAYAVTKTGTVIGTPAYLAPEQARGTPVAASDQFALAVLAYELLSGRRPWRAEDPVALLAAILTDPPPPLDPKHRAYDAVLRRALAKDPSARYRDVRTFGEAFAAAGARPLHAPDIGTADTLATPAGTVEALPSTRREAAPRGRLWTVFAVAGTVLTGGALLATGLLGEEQPIAEEQPATLAHDTVVACPVFEVEAAGDWLGAAAASLVCERLRWMRGGHAELTRIPAELLDFPRTPQADFPRDPFDGSRDASLAAAGDLFLLDGRVERDGGTIRLMLRAPSAEWTGEAPDLAGAVRDAMEGMGEAWWSAADDEPSPRELLARFDMDAWVAAGLPCAVLEDLPDRLSPSMATAARACGWEGTEREATELERVRDEVGTLVALPARSPEEVDELLLRLGGYDAPVTRVWEASLLLHAGRLRAASDRALQAVDADPRRPDAWYLLVRSRAVGRRWPASVAATAWMPWDAMQWSARGRSTGNLEDRVEATKRAFVLAPYPRFAGVYVEALLEAGEVEGARLVGARVRSSDAPGSERWAAVIDQRIEASEGELAAALEHALTHLDSAPDLADDASHAAYLAREIGALLGRGEEVSDRVVRRFVLDPAASERASISWGAAIGGLHCALASEALREPCFARLDELIEEHPIMMDLEGSEHFLEGHRRASEGDWEAAAASYRRVAQRDSIAVTRQALLMARALDAADEPELAERVDEWLLAHPGELGGANAATVRAARRALARGDEDAARDHASQVIDAWVDADVAVPAVTEMRALLANLGD